MYTATGIERYSSSLLQQQRRNQNISSTHFFSKPSMETATAAFLGPNFALPSPLPSPLYRVTIGSRGGRRRWTAMSLLEKGVGPGSSGSNGKKVGVPNSNYVVPLDMAAAGLTRPLNEILRDLNKRVPDKIINPGNNSIPWYHANRMLSFYAPGWCGEVRDVIFSESAGVTVVYRVTIRGSDGEAHRESTGTASLNDGRYEDAVASAEEIAFCRACARFGFGLYLYHEDEAL